MSETRTLAAILCSDAVGYSRLAGADEDRILARLRALAVKWSSADVWDFPPYVGGLRKAGMQEE